MSKKRKRDHDGAAEDAVLQNETELVCSEDEDMSSSDTSSASGSSSDRHLPGGDGSVDVHKKIAQGTKHMIRAFKKAKTFEVRKIIKRIKTANAAKDPEKVSRLEKELKIAKTLGIHPYAIRHLHKILAAEDLVARNPQLLPTLPEIPSHGQDDSTIKNLVGRLTSASAIKIVATSLIPSILRATLAQFDPPSPPPRRKAKPGVPKVRPSTSPATAHSMSPASFLRSDAPAPESDVIEEEENDRSSEEDDEPERKKNKFASFPPETAPKVRPVLPALSTGYIPASDSESDPDEELNTFLPTGKIRKNRRGQRARQAIWLKKYGRNARHLHPELEAVQSTNTSRKNKKRPQTVVSTAKLDVVNEATATTTQPAKKVNDPHPSWTAKRNLREQQKTLMSSVKPQKIVFD